MSTTVATVFAFLAAQSGAPVVPAAAVEPDVVVPVEVAPIEAVPVEAVPVEAATVEAATVEAVPVDEAVPVEAVPVEAVPVQATVAPFDTTWMNGQSKQKSFPLGSFNGVVTPSLYLDASYGFSLNQPRDNTLTGGGTVGRHNEIGINLASFGIDWNVANVIGRVSLQFGSQLAMVQEGDGSVLRGRNLTTDALEHLREAAIGYHFDVLEGVNVEAGILGSFVGMESYLLAENWSYNRALVGEFTPYYFTGVRAQVMVTDTLKIEPWLLNGYQTYGKFNDAPAVGLSVRYVPVEWLAVVANGYLGTDTRGDPERVRLHHDHSINLRVYNDPESMVLSKLAVSINNHIGTETGGDAAPFDVNHFIGTSVSARAWTAQDHVAVTGRFEYLQEPGGYALQLPPPGFVAGADFSIIGVTGGLEIMPTDFFSLRPEVVYRSASQPFFAGRGGTTSSDGFTDTVDADFVPDVVKDQVLFTIAANFRL